MGLKGRRTPLPHKQAPALQKHIPLSHEPAPLLQKHIPILQQHTPYLQPLSLATGEQSYNTVVRLLQAHACTREARSCTTGAHACTILQEYTPARWKHVHLQQRQMASPLASSFKNLFWWRGQPVGRNSLPSHKKCHNEQGG